MSHQVSTDSGTGWRRLAVARVDVADLVEPVLDHQVGQGRARLVVEAAPVVVGADDFAGGHAGQAFAGAVPDQDLGVAVEHENGNASISISW
jgi:hypothetical protein